MSASELEIIRRCRAGDTSGFDLLVKQHYARVYNTAFRMLGEADRAADATQAAFVRAFGSLDRFRGEAAFSTWLYRIVVNVCLDQLREVTKQPASLTLVGDEDDEPQDRAVPDELADPVHEVTRHERQALVHQALQHLAPEHRAILVLYDLSGLSYQEAASVLGIPVGTVKSRLNRARNALKNELQPYLELFEP